MPPMPDPTLCVVPTTLVEPVWPIRWGSGPAAGDPPGSSSITALPFKFCAKKAMISSIRVSIRSSSLWVEVFTFSSIAATESVNPTRLSSRVSKRPTSSCVRVVTMVEKSASDTKC
ncbi:hypothetical protein KSP39_PZI012964 [Platanthera zijinensis]|uniref:Uncharacterized protein n=1 Tax=Platanthera zijinensis TaxID=2320716 RepID=A0AAP0BBJ1_9ASPA